MNSFPLSLTALGWICVASAAQAAEGDTGPQPAVDTAASEPSSTSSKDPDEPAPRPTNDARSEPTVPAADATSPPRNDDAPSAENAKPAGGLEDDDTANGTAHDTVEANADTSPPVSVGEPAPAVAPTDVVASAPDVAAEKRPGPIEVQMGEFTFELGGYYQTRFKALFNLFADEGGGADPRHPTLATHRLKLEPTLRVGDWAKLSLDIDGIRGVLWGDNAGLASTALFAANPSNTLLSGFEVDSVVLRRAWMEFQVPIGVVRLGRMPNHWGMGILANDGNGFDDLFGDNEQGTTFDRVLFATRPIAIVQKVLGQEDAQIPLYFALAYDRLVDDPMATYYGDCRAGLQEGDAGYRARCDEDGDGVTDTLPNQDDNRNAEDRTSSWWGDNQDDVYEVVYVVIYRGEDLEWFGQKGDFTAGSYVASRFQGETDSTVWISDAYVKADFLNAHLEFEFVHIAGNTRALLIPNPEVEVDPYNREASITGYVGRLGYDLADVGLWMEYGYASGDGNVFDNRFTGRALHPDHNVGLLLYDEILARVSANNSLSPSLGSQGGVYNSSYIFPNLRYRFLPDWQLVGAFLLAWPDQPDADSIRCSKEDGSARCQEFVERAIAEDIATSPFLGWEADLALKGNFSKQIRMSLEGAIANVTDRVPVAKAGLFQDPFYYTVQLRLAYDFTL